jgi:hypothetical protein
MTEAAEEGKLGGGRYQRIQSNEYKITSLDDLQRFLRELLSSKRASNRRNQPQLLFLLLLLAVTHHDSPPLSRGGKLAV